MDEIDAEIEDQKSNGNQMNTVTASDGIQIAVGREEEELFNDEEQLNYEDDETDEEEEILPIPNQNEGMDLDDISSDADTVVGDDGGLNTSISSSTIISFKDPQTSTSAGHGVVKGKPIAKMSPEELVDANPDLKNLLEDKKDNNTESTPRPTPSRRVVKANHDEKKIVCRKRGKSNIINKSPSDTTIYASALKHTPPVKILEPVPNKTAEPRSLNNDSLHLIKTVSNFVEQARAEQDRVRSVMSSTQVRSEVHKVPNKPMTRPRENIVQLTLADNISQEMIQQVEHHKVPTELPRGNFSREVLNKYQPSNLVDQVRLLNLQSKLLNAQPAMVDHLVT